MLAKAAVIVTYNSQNYDSTLGSGLHMLYTHIPSHGGNYCCEFKSATWYCSTFTTHYFNGMGAGCSVLWWHYSTFALSSDAIRSTWLKFQRTVIVVWRKPTKSVRFKFPAI